MKEKSWTRTDRLLMAALVVLVILLTLVLALRETAWTRQDQELKKLAQENSAAWSAEMDRLIGEEDYLGYEQFTAAHRIGTDQEAYRRFYPLDYMIGQFTAVYSDFVQVIYPRDDYVKSYTTESFCENLDRFYKVTEWDYWVQSGQTSREKEIRAAAEGMDGQIQALLRAHLGLSAEDAASLRGMKKAKRDELLQERINSLREQSPEDTEAEEEDQNDEENVH